jgi:hypothetical protein
VIDHSKSSQKYARRIRRRRMDLYFSAEQARIAGIVQYRTHGNGFVMVTEVTSAGKPYTSKFPDIKLIVKNTTGSFARRVSEGILREGLYV